MGEFERRELFSSYGGRRKEKGRSVTIFRYISRSLAVSPKCFPHGREKTGRRGGGEGAVRYSLQRNSINMAKLFRVRKTWGEAFGFLSRSRSDSACWKKKGGGPYHMAIAKQGRSRHGSSGSHKKKLEGIEFTFRLLENHTGCPGGKEWGTRSLNIGPITLGRGDAVIKARANRERVPHLEVKKA